MAAKIKTREIFLFVSIITSGVRRFIYSALIHAAFVFWIDLI